MAVSKMQLRFFCFHTTPLRTAQQEKTGKLAAARVQSPFYGTAYFVN